MGKVEQLVNDAIIRVPDPFGGEDEREEASVAGYCCVSMKMSEITHLFLLLLSLMMVMDDEEGGRKKEMKENRQQ
jgi:hypothetical protein